MPSSNKVGTVSIWVPIVPIFIVFLTLKLTHVIDWSWWWVTSPIWIPIGVYLMLCLLVGLCLQATESTRRQGRK